MMLTGFGRDSGLGTEATRRYTIEETSQSKLDSHKQGGQSSPFGRRVQVVPSNSRRGSMDQEQDYKAGPSSVQAASSHKILYDWHAHE